MPSFIFQASVVWHTACASYQIRKIAGCACAGNAGNVSPRRQFQRKPLVSDPGMHHGTCVTHVPWCMSGSLTCGDGENVPGIRGAWAPAILRIWQEAHVATVVIVLSSCGHRVSGSCPELHWAKQKITLVPSLHGTLYPYIHSETLLKILIPESIMSVGPLLLTRVNFNPGMDK